MTALPGQWVAPIAPRDPRAWSRIVLRGHLAWGRSGKAWARKLGVTYGLGMVEFEVAGHYVGVYR